jgi:5'-3' exonuclease
MILLIDADSLVYASCLISKREGSNDKFYRNIEDSIAKFDQQYMKIVNDLEERYDIEKIYTFNNSKGNFRKLLTKTYKANRNDTVLPPLLPEMHEFVRKEYNGLYAYGIETDDLVAKYWYDISSEVGRDKVMIVSIDKDYKQFPCLMYNYHYKHRVVYDITEQDAMYNFYEQMIIGDGADNVNYFKGKGRAYAKKLYKSCNTKFCYVKNLYNLFKEKYRGKAKQKYIECYNLLKLRTKI